MKKSPLIITDDCINNNYLTTTIMLSINVRNANRQSVIARKPVDSIRSSFKSTQFSIRPNNPLPGKCIPICVPNFKMQPNVPPLKPIPNQTKTIQHSRKNPPSAYSRVRQGGSVAGMNDHFLYQRKENHLNTCFNIRKNKLKEITKMNRNIYQKLNSQKSIYSSTDMKKSYQSIQAIKDRLSQSKISQRSSLSRDSSRKSLNQSKSTKGILKKKEKGPKIEVKARNIHQVNAEELDKFKILFEKNDNRVSRQTIDNNGKEYFKQNSYRRNGVYIRSVKASGRISVQSTKEIKDDHNLKGEGGLLHRIMEDDWK